MNGSMDIVDKDDSGEDWGWRLSLEIWEHWGGTDQLGMNHFQQISCHDNCGGATRDHW